MLYAPGVCRERPRLKSSSKYTSSRIWPSSKYTRPSSKYTSSSGDQRIGDSIPTPPPSSSQVDHLDESPPPKSERSSVPPAVPAAEAFDRATRGGNATARRSNKILLLFSGPYRRPDGLATFLRKFGFEVELLDNDPVTGGGSDGDILNDDVHNNLLSRVSRAPRRVSRHSRHLAAPPPCSTFSITRHFAATGASDGDTRLVSGRAWDSGRL